MSDMMRIGLVGCGAAGRHHARAAHDNAHCCMIACTDPQTARADALATEYGIPTVCETLEEMLKWAEIDLLILATWPALHFEQILEASRSGIRAILCEQALARDGRECELIDFIALEKGVFLAEGFMYRYHPQLPMTKALISSIGGVTRITGVVAGQLEGPQDWRLAAELGGGAMLTLGGFMVNACNYLAGAPPDTVRCAVTHGPGGIDLAHEATITYENGAVAEFAARLDAAAEQRLEIHGPGGTIILPEAFQTVAEPRQVVIRRAGIEREDRFDFAPMDSYRLQLDNICNCLSSNAVPILPMTETLLNHYTISALLRAAHTGATEPLPISRKRRAALAKPQH